MCSSVRSVCRPRHEQNDCLGMLSWTDNEMTYLAGVGDVSTPTRAVLSVVLQLGVWPASRPISQQVASGREVRFRTCTKQASQSSPAANAQLGRRDVIGVPAREGRDC